MNSETALVLFSGGQDSTVCLAWALERFSRVETIGFDYGQRHAVELSVRARLREKMSALNSGWKARLGDDHMIELDALAAISDTALTRETAIEIADSGLPTTFVPGRNLGVFLLCRRARLSARRPPHRRRHVRDRLLRLSRLPRRHRQGHAGRADARHGQARRHPYAADVDRQGRDICHGVEIGGEALLDLIVEDSHSCYLGDRSKRHDWGYGCGTCPACELRAQGFAKFKSAKDIMIDNEDGKTSKAAIFLVLFCLTIPAANWMIGNVGTVCVPNGPCLVPVAPGMMAPSGVLMIGAALVLRDLVQRRLGVEFGLGAIVAGAAISAGLRRVFGDCLGGRVPAVGVCRFRGLYAAGATPPGGGGGRVKHCRAGGRTRSCSSGSLSARSTSCSARSSASSGWCCSAIPLVA